MIIFEKTPYGERNIELQARLFEDRIIWLTSHINAFNAEQIAQQMQILNLQDNSNIKFYINSPGGSVTDGLMIYDIMHTIRPKVDIFCVGQCCSMAAVLLASATGTRYAYENATIMIHKVSAGTFGKEPDMAISLEHTQALNDRLMRILARNTNKSIEQIYTDTDRDKFFTAREALDYGLVDVMI